MLLYALIIPVMSLYPGWLANVCLSLEIQITEGLNDAALLQFEYDNVCFIRLFWWKFYSFADYIIIPIQLIQRYGNFEDSDVLCWY